MYVKIIQTNTTKASTYRKSSNNITLYEKTKHWKADNEL